MNYIKLDRKEIYQWINSDPYGKEMISLAERIETFSYELKKVRDRFLKIPEVNFDLLSSKSINDLVNITRMKFPECLKLPSDMVLRYLDNLNSEIELLLVFDWAYIAPERVNNTYYISTFDGEDYFLNCDGIEFEIPMDGNGYSIEIEFYTLENPNNKFLGSFDIIYNPIDNTKGIDGCIVDIDLIEIVDKIRNIAEIYEKYLIELDEKINILDNLYPPFVKRKSTLKEMRFS